ncbi:MAG: nodulation protein NfeD, partial [Cytophagaceae bacterium]
MGRIRTLIITAAMLLGLLSFYSEMQGQQPGAAKKVFVMEIRDEIDPVMSRYVSKALHEAERQKADLIVVDMNTYGGALNDADTIRKRFLELKKPI